MHGSPRFRKSKIHFRAHFVPVGCTTLRCIWRENEDNQSETRDSGRWLLPTRSSTICYFVQLVFCEARAVSCISQQLRSDGESSSGYNLVWDLDSESVNQSPLQNTCEATDGLTLFRFTSCVDSVHKNQYTNDEFFTASQPKPSLILPEPRSWHIYQREFFDDAQWLSQTGLRGLWQA